MIGLRAAAAAAALLGCAASNDALAQTPSSSNYRSLAVCEEVEMGGRWFNTFGEGRCPPGSRRPTHGGDVNAQNMRRLEAQVQALGAAQQAVLAVGRAIGERYQAESDERAATYAYHLIDPSDPIASVSLYAPQVFMFPTRGTVVRAVAGDPIATTGDGFYSQCFISLDNGSASIMGAQHIIKADQLACKLRSRDVAYIPLYLNYTHPGSNYITTLGQTISRRDNGWRVCYRIQGANMGCIDTIPFDRLFETNGLVELIQTTRTLATFEGVTDGQLQVRLEKSASVPEARTIRFDLSSSRTIEFAGATFEVLEFTDDEIIMQRRQ